MLFVFEGLISPLPPRGAPGQNPEPRRPVSGQFVNLRDSKFSFPPPGLLNPENVTQLWRTDFKTHCKMWVRASVVTISSQLRLVRLSCYLIFFQNNQPFTGQKVEQETVWWVNPADDVFLYRSQAPGLCGNQIAADFVRSETTCIETLADKT